MNERIIIMSAEENKNIGGVNVRIIHKEISYLRENGELHSRVFNLYIPEDSAAPMPCVFYVHYVLSENSLDFSDYLHRGWAIATPEVYQNLNLEWMDDDLFFNNAVLCELRKQSEIAQEKILLTGFSAGGYMTMILSILHVGICGCVSMSGVTNNYFMALGYHKSGQEINEQAYAKLPEEIRANDDCLKEHIPAWRIFTATRNLALFHPKNTIEKYIERSPVTNWQCLCNLFVFSHFTSDNIVPIDMLTSKYTYDQLGKSMPKEVKAQLKDFDLPEPVSLALDERLPKSEVYYSFRPAPDVQSNETIFLRFDPKKKYNINVFDEGPVENAGGHFKNPKIGRQHFIEFAEFCFSQTSAKTSWINAGKILLLAKVYQGKSKLLPVFDSDRKNVYGTLEMTRKCIIDELRRYSGFHNDLDRVFDEAITLDTEYRGIIQEMRNLVHESVSSEL